MDTNTMKKAFKVAGYTLLAAAGAEVGMYGYTILNPDQYRNFYVSKASPVDTDNVSRIQSPFLQNKKDRFVFTGVAEAGQKLRQRTFIVSKDAAEKAGLVADDSFKPYTVVCSFSHAQGQFVPGIFSPISNNVKCSAASPEDQARIERSVNAKRPSEMIVVPSYEHYDQK